MKNYHVMQAATRHFCGTQTECEDYCRRQLEQWRAAGVSCKDFTIRYRDGQLVETIVGKHRSVK